MKLIFTLALLISFSTAFSQWTKVQQLGSSDIFTVYHKDNTLYAGGRSIIYISRDKGQTWESTAIPGLSLVNSIIVYKNELYATAPHSGVFKSMDGGRTWQDISAGIFPDVADFCEYRGDLYAATYGSSVFKLNSVSRTDWQLFSNGLSNQSANIPAIAANSNAIIAGTLANGMYGQLQANSTNWNERFLTGRIDPNEGTYDIITAHDTLFYAGHTGKFYMSTDNGLSWKLFGNRLASLYSPLLNARQALLTSAYFFDGANFNTAFFYIKKDALQNPFINFSVVTNHFTYKIDILDDKIWDASDRGLFYMPVSNLPGIFSDDNSENLPLPVHFTLFNTKCDGGKVLITWKTAQEQNSSQFNIERSINGINWTAIGNLPAAGNSINESSYSFTDNNPVQNGFYRIAQRNIDGQIHYTNTLQSSCTITEAFKLWPNPVQDLVFINIVSGSNSQAIIKIFDSKGALVKMQGSSVFWGNNQITVDMKSMATGMYSLSVYWNNGQTKKTVQILKQ